MQVLSKAEVSALTLDFELAWKPTDQDIDLLQNTVHPPIVYYEDPLGMPVHPLEAKTEITIPIGKAVLAKMQAFSRLTDLPVPVLISRLLDMEATQYGHFDLIFRLRLASSTGH